MQPITPKTIEELASVANLPLEAGRVPMLAAVFQQLMEAARAMDALDLDEAEPALVFDPRWEE